MGKWFWPAREEDVAWATAQAWRRGRRACYQLQLGRPGGLRAGCAGADTPGAGPADALAGREH
eukprot:2981499-Alexandrium_andersonii.AAC.1